MAISEKRLLRNAAELKISINNSVHSSRQVKYKVIIKLFPIKLIKHIFFSTKTVFSAFFIGLLI